MKNIKKRMRIALTWGFAMLVTQVVHSQMFVPGQFAVSPSGAATYTIPIQVPPGVAGMEPKLALVYNSQGGNGLLGIGWSLSGLSTITRCPRTIAQDGVSGGVNDDLNDRYCLDGQRLLAVSGSDGGNGTEYRTEQDGFSKIVSYAESGSINGPGSFIVKTKSGLTMEFGKTEDSRIEAQGHIDASGHGVVAVWALDKVTDAKGNSYTASYVEDNANGLFYPKTVSYAFRGSTPNAYVNFSYSSRTDLYKQYSAGSLVSLSNRMTEVDVHANGGLVKSYKLGYGYSNALIRSQLSSVAMCDAASNCLPATTTTWLAGSMGYANGAASKFQEPFAPTQSDASQDEGFFKDVNGDGIPDYVVAWSNGGRRNLMTYLGASNGSFAAGMNSDLGCCFQATSSDPGKDVGNFVDVNGDGLMDYVAVYSSTGANGGNRVFAVYLSKGDGTYAQAVSSVAGCCYWGTASDAGKDIGNFIDVNSDGLIDYVGVSSSTGANGGNRVFTVYLSKGDGSYAQGVSSTAGCCYWGTNSDVGKDVGNFFDVNGDGLTDYVAVSSSTGANGGERVFTAYLSKGDGTYAQGVSSTAGCCYWGTASDFGKDVGSFIDVNGDGLMDYVAVSSSTGVNGGNRVFTVYLSKGDGTYAQGISSTAGCCYWGSKLDAAQDIGNFIDVNGDGLMDYVAVSSSTGANGGNRVFTVYLSKGDGTYAQGISSTSGCCYWGTASDSGKDVGNFLDLNGDGLTDYVTVSSSTGANGGNRVFSIYLSKGDGTYTQGVNSTAGCCYWGTASDAGKDAGTFIDANGDGMLDYLAVWSDSGVRSISNYANALRPLAVNAISTGNGGSIVLNLDSLSRLFGNGYSVQGTSSIPERYVSVSNSMPVTRMVSVDTGIGTTRQTIYGYGKWINAFGNRRGSRGFQWTQSQDAATGLVSRTCYRQDWPYVGMVDKVITATSTAALPACTALVGYNDLSPLTANGSGLLSLTLNAYKFNAYTASDLAYTSPVTCADDPGTGRTGSSCPASATAAGNRYQVYAYQSLMQSNDWNGSTFIALPATRTTMAQDNFGNATLIKAETLNADGKTPSGYSKTTSNTYMAPDMTNWLLGRLQQSTVQAVSP
jgi:hypothetical protein